MQQQFFHWLRNAKQLNILNRTKVNGIPETKPEKNYETKRNFTLTKQNETKRNFAVFCVSRNKQNFTKQFFVSLCFVFRETKKGCEMETLPKYNGTCL
jgi:hypothetical protein